MKNPPIIQFTTNGTRINRDVNSEPPAEELNVKAGRIDKIDCMIDFNNTYYHRNLQVRSLCVIKCMNTPDLFLKKIFY